MSLILRKITPKKFQVRTTSKWFMHQLKDFKNRKALNLAEDKDGRDVFLAESPYALQIAMEKYPDIEFHFTSEF